MDRFSLDIIICTHNHADLLDLALDALARQVVPGHVDWGVAVVDNNCTDDTGAVIESYRRSGSFPGPQVIREPEQGLTPARLAGVKATKRDWLAFVDDDNLLHTDWIAKAADFASRYGECSAFGGRVTLAWEEEPASWMRAFGYAYAEQDHGNKICQVSCLVGAGIVIRRAALEKTGWLDGPLLADRVGQQLVSGGDVEMALRLSVHGPLYYTPDCRMDHRIPKERLSFDYLARINLGLGVSKFLGDALLWRGGYGGWLWHAAWEGHVMTFQAIVGLIKALIMLRSLGPARIRMRFAQGYNAALIRMLLGAGPRPQALLGRAASPTHPAQ